MIDLCIGDTMEILIDLEGLTVEQTLDRWPETARIFLKYRMNCVGCCMDRFETLEQVLANYAIPPRAFLNDLHDTIDQFGQATAADFDSSNGMIFSGKA
jgi:hybrid cluster-associated redox disulfide protein